MDSDPVVLRLTCDGEVLHTGYGKWLHPLLDLTRALAAQPQDLTGCVLYDKIIGRAAALLIVRLGIRRVYTDTMSERALSVFERWAVEWSANQRVARIDCLTEEILADEADPDRAFRVIRARALAARAHNDPQRCALRLEGVSVVRDETPVLDTVDLSVGRGEKLLITGANGAGKTTLLETIMGTVPLRSGAVSVQNEYRTDPRAPRDAVRAARSTAPIGYVNQEAVSVSFPLSVEEVVAIGVAAVRGTRREKRIRVRDAMAATGCGDLSRRMYRTLSGGEKQRVTIARCLAQEAEILLLDEPTASLDVGGKRELVALIEQLADRRDITVVMVTHEADTIDQSGWRQVKLKDRGLTPVGAGA